MDKEQDRYEDSSAVVVIPTGTYVTEQSKSPQRVALERGGWLALGVAVTIALLEGLGHALEALQVGFETPASIRAGVLVALPLIVAALRAWEGRRDEAQATRVE